MGMLGLRRHARVTADRSAVRSVESWVRDVERCLFSASSWEVQLSILTSASLLEEGAGWVGERDVGLGFLAREGLDVCTEGELGALVLVRFGLMVVLSLLVEGVGCGFAVVDGEVVGREDEGLVL